MIRYVLNNKTITIYRDDVEIIRCDNNLKIDYRTWLQCLLLGPFDGKTYRYCLETDSFEEITE